MATKRPLVNNGGRIQEISAGDILPADVVGTINPISGFQAHKNGTDQNFTTSTATKVTFGTEVFDINSEFASDRFTIISGGKYLISAAVHVTAFGVGTTSTKLFLYKNGSLFKTLMTSFVLTDMTMQGNLIVDVADGDYFEVFVQFVGLTSGTATIEGDAIDTWFNAIRQASSPGNETTTSLGAITNNATSKTTPVDADMIPLMDSAASNIWKKLSWANLKTKVNAFFTDTVILTDGANVAVDASLGHKFRLTLGGDRTIDNPSGLYDGQELVFEIIQDGTGYRKPTFGSKYTGDWWIDFAPDSRTFLRFIYNSATDTLYLVDCSLKSAYVCLTANHTLGNNTNLQKLFDVPANGEITLPKGLYFIEGLFYISSMSSTSGNGQLDLKGAGTAVLGTTLYQAVGYDNTAIGAVANQSGSTNHQAASGNNVITGGTGTLVAFSIRGSMRITTAGTIIPSFKLTTAAAAVVQAGSYLRIIKEGTDTQTFRGQLS